LRKPENIDNLSSVKEVEDEFYSAKIPTFSMTKDKFFTNSLRKLGITGTIALSKAPITTGAPTKAQKPRLM
jgi:hypothetical protein